MTPMQELVAHLQRVAFDLRSVKIPRVVGALVKEQTDRRFETKQGPDGKTWSPWDRNYAKTRKAGDSLLIDYSTHESGPHLSDSIELQVTPTEIVVGTAVYYGGPNQETRPFLGLSESNRGEIEMRIVQVMEGWV